MPTNDIMFVIDTLNDVRHYKLNDEPVTLKEFIIDNEDTLEQWELLLIASLDVGENITFGGGAMAQSILERTY